MIKNNQNKQFIFYYLLYFFLTDANIFDALEVIGFALIIIFIRKYLLQEKLLSTRIIIIFGLIISPLLISESIQSIFLPIGYQYISISLIISFIFLETKGQILFQNLNNFQLIRLFSTAALCPFTYIAGPSASIEELSKKDLIKKKDNSIKHTFNNLNSLDKAIGGFFKLTLGYFLSSFEPLLNHQFLIEDFSIFKIIFFFNYGFFNFWKYYLLFAGASELCESFLLAINIKVIQNFNKPYLAIFYHEIWSRWHLNITERVRKYLFTPITLISLRRFSGLNPIIKFIFVEGFPSLILFSIIAIWHGGKITDITFALVSLFLTISSRALGGNNLVRSLINKNVLFREFISFLSITIFGLALSIYSFTFNEDIYYSNLEESKKAIFYFFAIIVINLYFRIK